MEFVLVRLFSSKVSVADSEDGLCGWKDLKYLEVAQLGELLAAVVELAGEGLDLLMDNLVRSHVASLRESLATDLTVEGSLASMSSLMCLVDVSKRLQ